MNVETGRIYAHEEYQTRLAHEASDGEAFDDHQAQFVADLHAGKIVEVSERVARQMRTGQRVEAKRARKAAKAARKRNR